MEEVSISTEEKIREPRPILEHEIDRIRDEVIAAGGRPLPRHLKIEGFDYFRGGYLVQHGNLFIPASAHEYCDPVDEESYNAGLMISPFGLDLMGKIGAIETDSGRINFMKLLEREIIKLHKKYNSTWRQECVDGFSGELIPGFEKMGLNANGGKKMFYKRKPLSVEIAEGIFITEHAQGSASKVYLVEIKANEKFKKRLKLIVKVKRSYSKVTQTPINEMLQIQEAQAHLDQFEESRSSLGLSRFVFASANMSCSIFEEGEPLPADYELTEEQFKALVRFIEHFNSREDDLWHLIRLDILNGITKKLVSNNFILRADGKLIIVDPFCRYRVFDFIGTWDDDDF